MEHPTDLKELYRNDLGCIYQSDSCNKLAIEFGGSISYLNIPCFLCFSKQVNEIDLPAMANNLDSDIEIFTPCSCERCFILNLREAYYLKDLMQGAKVMLELNSIIHEKLYRFSFA